MSNKKSNSNNNVFTLTGAVSQVKAVRQKKVAGTLLLAALSQRAGEFGHDDHTMAAELRVTFGYVMQLRNGMRAVDKISDELAEACAEYLGVPRLRVLILAERIKPQDYFTSVDLYRQDVERAMKFITADEAWGALISGELRSCEPDTLFGVVRLYETATGTVLMPNRQELKDLMEGSKRAE